MMSLPNFLIALPEGFLAVSAMAILLIGAFRTPNSGGLFVSTLLSVVAIVIVSLIVLFGVPSHRTVEFDGLFVSDYFSIYIKVLLSLSAILCLFLSVRYNVKNNIDRFEYPVLFLLSVTGMFVMISANDFLTLYLGLELQSLSLYVLAAFERDRSRSTEAGLKYFVLGALSSGMLLFGISYVYGFLGSTSFDALSQRLISSHDGQTIVLIVGMVFISVALAFKCSAVPFHMWAPDVYEGAPTPVTAFFSITPKIAALALFTRVMIGPFGALAEQWASIIWIMSFLSMILGSYAAINQTNIKRMMAYSSIGHVGYVLMGLVAASPEGIQALIVYLTIYLFMSVGVFAVILTMERDGVYVEKIDDLAGLSKFKPLSAAALAIFMFSMAGIPPLAGFLSKLAIFMSAINASLYVLATVGVITSVVGTFYYLRIIKIMYFDEVGDKFDKDAGDNLVKLVITLSSLMTISLTLIPSSIFYLADLAARSIFP